MMTPAQIAQVDAAFKAKPMNIDRFSWQPGDVQELDPGAKPEGWDDIGFVPYGPTAIEDGVAEDDFSESSIKRVPAGQKGGGQFQEGVGGETERPRQRAGGLIDAPADRAAWPQHIKALRVPPAWTDVKINPNADAELLVVGKDSKGRRQAVYSAKFAAEQAAAKFARIKELDQKFESIEQQNRANQSNPDKAIRAHADCMALIMALGIRPGSESDTGAATKAYGATTLLGKHVVTEDGKMYLRFTGKKGVAIDLRVTDRNLMPMLKKRAKKASFNGPLFPEVSDGSLLKYAHLFDGGGFKTKDFRTLLATKSAMNAISKQPAPTDAKSYKKAVRAVAVDVARRLGNTPVIALQSYINPAVFSGWRGAAGMATDAVMPAYPLPDAHWGSAISPLPDWRRIKIDAADDDEELEQTPPDVVAMLGFDPLEQDKMPAHDAMAFDRASVRTFDEDGRLHIKLTHISKATVNPYKGSEIPGWQELGLDPDKVYQLLRDPDELERAAPTFNNLPLLDTHIPVDVDEPQKQFIIGSTGTDAVFEKPYLDNSLVIWTSDGIEGVESEERQEISCAYHYEPDMTPGVYEGQRYDGVMRNIRGNHVALVPEGRAGPDVVVADGAMKGDSVTMRTIATDPSVSGKQHRAMEAAAHGHSDLGIPKKVGEEFEKADKGKSFDCNALARDMIRFGKDAGFEESKHPRDKSGKFGKGGEGKAPGRKGELFHGKHIDALREAYQGINKIDPAMPSYQKLIGMLDKMSQPQLTQLADAGIKFVSRLAANRIKKPAADRAGVSQSRSSSTTESKTMSKAKSLSKKAVMAKGALMALLPKMIAADAMPDLDVLLNGVKRKNWLKKKPAILAALRPLLATDEDIEETSNALNDLDNQEPKPEQAEDNEYDDVLELLRGKIADQDLAKVKELLAKHNKTLEPSAEGQDAETEEERKALEAAKAAKGAEDQPADFEGKPKDPVSKGAMDKAIAAVVEAQKKGNKIAIDRAIQETKRATLQLAHDIQEAEAVAMPYVGKMNIAFDSAEDVYKHALKAMDIKTKGIHPSAYKAILEAQPRPGVRLVANGDLATDELPKKFGQEFPDAHRLLSV